MFPGIRGLTSVERVPGANLRLGAALAVVAGAANAGGVLALGQFTSNMTGMASTLADSAALGHVGTALAAAASLAAFALGAAATAIMVNWGLRRGLRGAYCLPLACESALLLALGILGAVADASSPSMPFAAALALCFAMGLQNALVSKISRSEIRTTHITGLVTDAGIELGKAMFLNRDPRALRVRADRVKLRAHLTLIASFVGGGVYGALGYNALGVGAAIPLGLAVAALAIRPIAQDLMRRR